MNNESNLENNQNIINSNTPINNEVKDDNLNIENVLGPELNIFNSIKQEQVNSSTITNIESNVVKDPVISSDVSEPIEKTIEPKLNIEQVNSSTITNIEPNVVKDPVISSDVSEPIEKSIEPKLNIEQVSPSTITNMEPNVVKDTVISSEPEPIEKTIEPKLNMEQVNPSTITNIEPSEVKDPVISSEPLIENNVLNQYNDMKPQSTSIDSPISNTDLNKQEIKPKKKQSKSLIVVIVLLILILIGGLTFVLLNNKQTNESDSTVSKKNYSKDYSMSGNSLEDFDLYFLKLELEEKNMIYSPLSIKYALEMLYEGAEGDTKEQIGNILGEYEAKSYNNNDNMSFANAFFINNNLKETIKQDYIDKLKGKFSAEIIFDSFESVNNINEWVKNKTLGLLPNLIDSIDSSELFVLINALGIDMEWEEKFLNNDKGTFYMSYEHEKNTEGTKISWYAPNNVQSKEFSGIDEKISSMDIIATFNNYDILTEVGEEKIRNTVEASYRDYMNSDNSYCDSTSNLGQVKCSTLTDTEKEKIISDYLDSYIKSISENYKKSGSNTDFSFYVDEDVKVFAKDLKEYNGTTLQYVAFMPTNDSLKTFISNTSSSELSNLISNLKELKSESFKDGYVTKIVGSIPKFNFEYTLNLLSDLKQLGIENVFDSSFSDLSNMSSQKGTYINNVIHKANIEFTQDGIKASAATLAGGAGSASAFDYLFEVPYEEIDLTFDKPYMFIIMDKSTEEVWFTGSVYDPLHYSNDKTLG